MKRREFLYKTGYSVAGIVTAGSGLILSKEEKQDGIRNKKNKENSMKKIGIIICDRYHNCAGGKCFRSLIKGEGAFAKYNDEEVQIVGYTTCGGCPGGNIEESGEEFKKNGAEIIHLGSCFLCGYPPCPYIEHFIRFIPEKFNMEVVLGTHPIPEKYVITHNNLKTWESPEWKDYLKEVMPDKETRIEYNQ